MISSFSLWKKELGSLPSTLMCPRPLIVGDDGAPVTSKRDAGRSGGDVAGQSRRGDHHRLGLRHTLRWPFHQLGAIWGSVVVGTTVDPTGWRPTRKDVGKGPGGAASSWDVRLSGSNPVDGGRLGGGCKEYSLGPSFDQSYSWGQVLHQPPERLWRARWTHTNEPGFAPGGRGGRIWRIGPFLPWPGPQYPGGNLGP